MTAPTKPSTCGECVCFHDEPVYDTPKGDGWNCNPRGTRWRLPRRADQPACGTVHARKRDTAEPEQEAML